MKKILATISIGIGFSMHADIKISSPDVFGRTLMRAPLAVVVFYRDKNITDSEKTQTRALLTRLHLIENVAKRYMAFLLVNVDNVPVLADQFKIAQVPTIVLFKDGNPLIKDGKMVSLVGYPKGSQIMQTIEANFNDYIEQMSQARQEYQLYRDQMRAAYGWLNAWEPYPLYSWDRWYWPARSYYDPGFRSGYWRN